MQGRFNFHLLTDLYDDARFRAADSSVTRTYTNATSMCELLGMKIAVPKNDFDNGILEQMADVNGWNEAWIGVNDIAVEGEWMDQIGNQQRYQNWADGEPNNAGNDENCASLRVDLNGTWNDANCGSSYGVICETGNYYNCLERILIPI